MRLIIFYINKSGMFRIFASASISTSTSASLSAIINAETVHADAVVGCSAGRDKKEIGWGRWVVRVGGIQFDWPSRLSKVFYFVGRGQFIGHYIDPRYINTSFLHHWPRKRLKKIFSRWDNVYLYAFICIKQRTTSTFQVNIFVLNCRWKDMKWKWTYLEKINVSKNKFKNMFYIKIISNGLYTLAKFCWEIVPRLFSLLISI